MIHSGKNSVFAAIPVPCPASGDPGDAYPQMAEAALIRQRLPTGCYLMKERLETCPPATPPVSRPTVTGNIERYAVYARSAQLDLASIKRQMTACRKYVAARDGIEIVAYVDNGISGKSIGPNLTQLITDASKDLYFKHVVINDAARISRSLAVLLNVIFELHAHGITVHCADSHSELNDATNNAAATELSQAEAASPARVIPSNGGSDSK